jgi:hypothetical protein
VTRPRAIMTALGARFDRASSDPIAPTYSVSSPTDHRRGATPHAFAALSPHAWAQREKSPQSRQRLHVSALSLTLMLPLVRHTPLPDAAVPAAGFQ